MGKKLPVITDKVDINNLPCSPGRELRKAIAWERVAMASAIVVAGIYSYSMNVLIDSTMDRINMIYGELTAELNSEHHTRTDPFTGTQGALLRQELIAYIDQMCVRPAESPAGDSKPTTIE